MDFAELLRIISGTAGGALRGGLQEKARREEEARQAYQFRENDARAREAMANDEQYRQQQQAFQEAESLRQAQQFAEQMKLKNKEFGARYLADDADRAFRDRSLGQDWDKALMDDRTRRYGYDRMYERTVDAANIRRSVGGGNSNNVRLLQQAQRAGADAADNYIKSMLDKYPLPEQRPMIEEGARKARDAEFRRQLQAVNWDYQIIDGKRVIVDSAGKPVFDGAEPVEDSAAGVVPPPAASVTKSTTTTRSFNPNTPPSSGGFNPNRRPRP